MTLVLVVLVVVLAALGGFLGNLLEFAAWLVGLLVALGVVIALLVYWAFRRVRDRLG